MSPKPEASSVVRYASISLDRSIGSLTRSASRPDAFLIDDGYLLTRDLERDPNTIVIAHREGTAVRHIPWVRVTDSEVLLEGKAAAALVAPTPPVKPGAAVMPPVPAPEGPVVVSGARSADTRDALAHDGVKVTHPPRPKPGLAKADEAPKGGWPGAPKKAAKGAAKAPAET